MVVAESDSTIKFPVRGQTKLDPTCMSAADPEKATAAVNLGIRLSAVASVTSCDTDMPVSDNKVISTMGGMCAVDAL